MRKDKIEKIVKSRPKLYYIYKCMRGFRDSSFVWDVVRLNECDLILNFKTLGNLYPEKNIYYINCDSDVRGFFSLFCLVLDALAIADRYGLTPVVEFGENTLYYQGCEINGSMNPYEYYFKPVSEIQVADVGKCYRVLFYRDGQRNRDFNIPFSVASQKIVNEGDKDDYIRNRAYIYKKYIKLNSNVESYLNQTIESLLEGEKILGVHVRGTDFYNGYLNHAKAVTLEQYIEETSYAMEAGSFDRIFVATDEEKAICEFRKHFGNRVICYEDVLRSTDGKALHFSTVERKHHKYLLGLEVLRDMMTLAACDGLVAGYSNVSLVARIVKCSTDKRFSYLHIIDNGFNTDGIRFEKTKK
jgi:hypothetical protein